MFKDLEFEIKVEDKESGAIFYSVFRKGLKIGFLALDEEYRERIKDKMILRESKYENKKCQTCGGTGKVQFGEEGHFYWDNCPHCIPRKDEDKL